MMTVKELLKVIGIKKPTIKLMTHPKLIQVLNCCNEQDITVYEHDFVINEDAFIVFLDNIHSIETLFELLKNVSFLLSINYNPKEIAIFYNLYDSKKLQYNEDSEILIDDEYLMYATKEWTENTFIKQDKVLYISDKRMILKPNLKKIDEDDYVESYLLNLIALKKAKELGLLKEAIKKLQ